MGNKQASYPKILNENATLEVLSIELNKKQ
jgi:hypothetical protein